MPGASVVHIRSSVSLSSYAGGDGEGKGPKAKKLRPPDPLDWDDATFPALPERMEAAVQAELDPERIARMRDDAKKRIAAWKGGKDPATLDRKWNIKLTLGGIENTSATEWEVFVAARVATANELDDKMSRRDAEFAYTKSYKVKPNSKKTFKSMEMVFSKQWDGSYKKLEKTLVEMEVWMVQHTNFNLIIGKARKSLLDMGNESVFQTMFIKPISEGKGSNSYDIGILHINAVVSELFEFHIVASNWQFAPQPELQDRSSTKQIKIAMPAKAEGTLQACESEDCPPGHIYSWARCGEFKYVGTKLSLSMEAITITVYSNGKEQGKAIVSMGIAGEYPIAQGVVKKISANANSFVQGRIAGSVSVSSKSCIQQEEGTVSNDVQSSIPSPYQPSHSLVLFHLSPNLQYLVVEVNGADGLPIADTDSGSSNPLVRVKFDGIVQQSPHIENTITPAWNHTFYMPVRLPDEKIRTQPALYQTLLPIEMKSKGYLEMEIWHVEALPTEFLGGAKVDMHQTRYGEFQEKALCMSKVTLAKKGLDGEGQAEEEEVTDFGVDPRLMVKSQTKVLGPKREKLSGSWLQSVQKASVTFSCYFVPDFPEDFRYPPQLSEEEQQKTLAETFRESFKTWDNLYSNFREVYEAWFPDSLPKRNWVSRYTDAHGEELPLPMLVRPLALPASLATPSKIAHWIKCMEFTVPPRQRACGELSHWQRPEDILAVRKGSVQDHAVLLCCALTGLGKNAFICKGTVQKGKEHCWVMTREQGGTVTFWETTTCCKYHLAGRWIGDPSHSDSCKAKANSRWEKLATNKTWKSKEVVKARAAMKRDEVLQKMHELNQLPIAPWKELYQDDKLVVVPYDTIECVWNNMQLYGNLVNAHPACIYYDMEEDPRSWQKLLGENELRALYAEMGSAVAVGPAMSDYTVQDLQSTIESELKESIQMIRMRQGHESCFEESETLQEVLEQYLDFLESEMGMDADWVYDSKGVLQKPWGAPSPFNSKGYVENCKKSWAQYWKDKQGADEAKIFLPVKENHVLSGVPLHVSSCDLKEIRQHLLNCKPLIEYFAIGQDEVFFFTCVKVFSMPAAVASVWIFLGAEIPLPDDKIAELAKEQMQKFLEGGELAAGLRNKDMDDGDFMKSKGLTMDATGTVHSRAVPTGTTKSKKAPKTE